MKALWLKHDAHFGEHPKTLKLRRLAGRHADAAEVGWWRIVEGAKRYGEWSFEDEDHLSHVAGSYVRYVGLYREVGLLDDLTIHNAEEYQSPASPAERTAKHRSARNADTVTPETPREEKSREDKSRADTRSVSFDAYTRDGMIHVTPLVAEAWFDASGLTLLGSGVKAQDVIDDICRRHPESKVLAAIHTARDAFPHIPEANALAYATRNIVDPFLEPKAAQRATAEQREADAGRRRVQQTKKRTHDLGFHADERDPMCDACTGRAA